MMIYERPIDETVILPSPGSPPGMTASKSSKSSSFHSSFSSDRDSILADNSHFEEIGLEDDAPTYDRDLQQVKRDPSPFKPSYASNLRSASQTRNLSSKTPPVQQRSFSKPRSQVTVAQRDITTTSKTRPTISALQTNPRLNNARSTNTSQLLSESYMNPLPLRSFSNRPNSRPSGPSFARRHRSPSPNISSISLNPRDPAVPPKPRRSSWHINRDRKTEAELEAECDEDDGDDIPEHLILDNVPLSPRPPSERTRSQPPSKSPSPARAPKDKAPRVGNGTPANAAAHGSIGALRSPSWKSETSLPALNSPYTGSPPSPLKTRARSWNMTLAALNRDAKELTEKLEEHAEEMESKGQQRSSTGSMPKPRRASDESKTKHKSAMAELPPLRRTNIMIDPLPISKEKEAVLSRTRPSWLPPKDPAEERRHLREYQKMMQQSQENERRREAAKKAMSDCKDTSADSLMHLWEDEIVPRWNDAVRERRTRELWWRGVAPRSRGVVWTKAIGNELGLTETSFQAALGRAHDAESREKAGNGSAEDHKHARWMRNIRRDVEEQTWRDLRIFQAGGPLHQGLLDVLSAYSMYRSDIGYVSGCNTIAALLLINLPSPTVAFIALANILNRPLPLSFYAADAGAKSSAYNLLLQTLSTKSLDLYDHLVSLPGHQADTYLGDVFTALFSGHLALDEAARLWDVYVFEGDAVLVRAGLALLLDHEMVLLGTNSIEEVQKVLGGKKQRTVGKPGDEDRWMKAVRDAGKSS